MNVRVSRTIADAGTSSAEQSAVGRWRMVHLNSGAERGSIAGRLAIGDAGIGNDSDGVTAVLGVLSFLKFSVIIYTLYLLPSMRVLLAPLLLAAGVLLGTTAISPASTNAAAGAAAAPPPPSPQSSSCSSEPDCELSGTCTNGSCVCDAGWVGEHCTHLALVPNPPGHHAYHARDSNNASAFWNSWGYACPSSTSFL